MLCHVQQDSVSQGCADFRSNLDLFYFDLIWILQKSATGQYLFDRVCEFINLQERDYFGIRYMDSDNERSWLNMEKTVKQQMKSMLIGSVFID